MQINGLGIFRRIDLNVFHVQSDYLIRQVARGRLPAAGNMPGLVWS